MPYFVQWLDNHGRPTKRGVGQPDHRIMDATAFMDCVLNGKCWVCGQPIGRIGVFVIGPMCALNKNTAEPPSHQDCARWSVQGCPFLSNPEMVRREKGLPESTVDAAGIAIKRNPGVMALWASKTWKPYAAPGGFLIHTGEPLSIEWYSRGRPATREEVLASIGSGYPLLENVCEGDEDRAALKKAREDIDKYLPT